MKYTVEISRGCVADAFRINGKDWNGEYEPNLMSDAERSEFLDHVFLELRKGLDEGTVLLEELMYCLQCDNREFSESCDQCGDSVETITWEI